MSVDLRAELHQKINDLSEKQLELLTKIACFVEQKSFSGYEDWSDEGWQNLGLHDLWGDDEVEYTLADAQEVYLP